LVEPIALAYAQWQWLGQRWKLRHYDATVWCADRESPAAAVAFAFEGFGGAFAPLQSRDELGQLASLVKKRSPRVIVELGTARGGTFFVLAQMAAPDAILISVDLPGGIGGSGYPSWKVPILRSFGTRDQTVHLVRADSHAPSTWRTISNLLGDNPIDLLFIDADHSYGGVRADFEAYSPLVRRGGLICLHDVVHNPYNDAIEVDEFWNEIAPGRDTTVIRDTAGIDGFGIGVITQSEDPIPVLRAHQGDEPTGARVAAG
jgi:predicted O-methyltransferase YrrM